MQSISLPDRGDSSRAAVRVAQATDVDYEVTLRVVGSPGEWAIFSFDPAELNTGTNLIPLGGTIIVQAGQHHTMRLRPYQAIYGKGSTSDPYPVCVSISMSEMA